MLTGLAPVAEKLFVPSVTITVYGAVPSVTATLRFVEFPAQIVASPVKTDDDGGGTTCGFNSCAAGAVNVKHEAQVFEPLVVPKGWIVVTVVAPFT